MDLFKEHGVTLQELVDRIAEHWNGDADETFAETLELVVTLAREAGYAK